MAPAMSSSPAPCSRLMVDSAEVLETVRNRGGGEECDDTSGGESVEIALQLADDESLMLLRSGGGEERTSDVDNDGTGK